jgi:tetratricopeptide (TPR) repeat protein
MQNKEEFAEKALKLLGEAQSLEENGDIESAIERYQESAEYLKNSGVLIDRAADIYTRIEQLKQYQKEQFLYQKTQKIAEIERFQEEAFALLDGASKAEAKGYFENAIEQYESAITLLTKAGWMDAQVQNLYMKISQIKEKVESQQLAQRSQQLNIPEPVEQTVPEVETHPQVTDAFGKKKDLQQAEKVQKYKERKEHEEQIQEEAFKYLDNAKLYERDGKLNEAIESYGKAIELLQSIGWQEQISNIQKIVERLKNQKLEIDNIQKIPLSEPIRPKTSTLLSKPTKVKLDEDYIQSEAFTLIDMAKKLDREKKYEKAISKFQSAIELFKKIEWDSYIQPLLNFIKDIKEKQKTEVELQHIKSKRENEI